MNKENLMAIVGPTAVGKTDLSIAAAQALGAEIISGDSMLVYRGMDIGTAKPTTAEMRDVAHHLIDIREPHEDFSVTEFKAIAENLITAIGQRGKLPLLAGGTGLYVKSLLEDYQFSRAPGDDAYRKELEALAAAHGKTYVHDLLAAADPAAAARLHVNDFRRVIRALEVARRGERVSQENKPAETVYNALVIGLTMERSELYARIEQRVDSMMAAGLIEEVESLLRRGITVEHQSMKGIGYKEIAAYLQGETTLAEAVAAIKQSTRHFAKRQMTWFRKMPYIQWLDVKNMTKKQIMEKISQEAAGKFLLK